MLIAAVQIPQAVSGAIDEVLNAESHVAVQLDLDFGIDIGIRACAHQRLAAGDFEAKLSGSRQLGCVYPAECLVPRHGRVRIHAGHVEDVDQVSEIRDYIAHSRAKGESATAFKS